MKKHVPGYPFSGNVPLLVEKRIKDMIATALETGKPGLDIVDTIDFNNSYASAGIGTSYVYSVDVDPANAPVSTAGYLTNYKYTNENGSQMFIGANGVTYIRYLQLAVWDAWEVVSTTGIGA